MVRFWMDMLFRARMDSLALFEQNPRLLLLGLLGAVITAILVLVFRGREAFVEHMKANVAIVFGGAILTWMLVFVWTLLWLPHLIRKEADGQPQPSFKFPPIVAPTFWGRRSSQPPGPSLPSDEPSERAALRMIQVDADMNGLIFHAKVSVRNVGKYIALPVSLVRSAVKKGPLLPVEEEKMFDDAPDLLNPHRRNSGIAWRMSSNLTAIQPWYPGDTKSFNLEYFPVADPGSKEEAEYIAGDRGFYVLTRAFFRDKQGTLPYRDSCTYFSRKSPKGFRCWKHND
jgi:hypothetical protein